jgi:hypothetical protein
MTYSNDPLTPAQDGFEQYYAEKIWEWIPPFYRDEDGLAANPDVLRGLVEILAHQAAIARRSIDRLWDDAFIELCDDWAIPYLGDLVGTRLVNELNRRGRRVDVAKTIYYRRRKGTPAVLERLTQDITGWEGTVVESFRRLGRTRHGLDPEPMKLLGPVSQTPPGGFANLRSGRGASLVNGPFDEFAHTPDFRRLRGTKGRYNIPKLNFHLYRLQPFKVEFATPYDLGTGQFTFDPSGRDIPLFRPDQRLSTEAWQLVQEWQLPAPIPCRLLGDARYTLSTDTIAVLTAAGMNAAAAEELASYVGIPFRHEPRLRQTLASLDSFSTIPSPLKSLLVETLLAASLTPASPKAYLIPTPIHDDPIAIAVITGNTASPDKSLPEGLPPIEHQQIVSANLERWGAQLTGLDSFKTLVIDPERGRFWFRTLPTDPVWVSVYYYGFSGEIGAGTYDRSHSVLTDEVILDVTSIDQPGPIPWAVSTAPTTGVLQFADSKTYLPDGDVSNIEQLTLQAADKQRPYLRREASNWIFTANGTSDPSELVLEGLWLGMGPVGANFIPVLSNNKCPLATADLILDGHFDQVMIRHCTLDPGGEKARIAAGECQPIPVVRVVVRGSVEELIIESSIVGPIVEDPQPPLGTSTNDNNGVITHLIIRDSIVQSLDFPNQPAIQTFLGAVEMQRVTVFGDVLVNQLTASEALIQGLVRVLDNQHGCFRFSATHDLPSTRLPHQFESHLYAPNIPNHVFVSRRFGHPGYGQLSPTAPQELLQGAENRSEIGAFSKLLNPIKLEDLKAKVNEFTPFGLIAQYINET